MSIKLLTKNAQIIFLFLCRHSKFHNNRIIQFPSNVFDRLPLLRYLQVEGDSVHCDCATLEYVRRLEQRKVRPYVICATPQEFKGRSIRDMKAEDFRCGRLEPLVTGDGSTMFTCRADDNLVLDEFETSYDGDDTDQVDVEEVGIQTFASNLIGEHECVLNQLFGADGKRQHVRMAVTMEANHNEAVSINADFKAELHVRSDVTVNTDRKIEIQCPDSGEYFTCFSTNKIQIKTFYDFVHRKIHLSR